MSDTEKMTDEELTDYIAINVMGWERRVKLLGHKYPCVPQWIKDGTFARTCEDFAPPTSGNDMLIVIEAMRQKGWNVAQHHFRPSHVDKMKHDAHFLHERIHVYAKGATAQRAVAVAACKAIKESKK